MTVCLVSKRAQFLLLLMAAVTLMPVYGSWLDINYAGRQPAHKHLYVGKGHFNHHTPESEDVVNLPDQDATGQPVLLVYLPDEQISAKIVGADDLSFNITVDCHSPEDTFLPPPDHPPRI